MQDSHSKPQRTWQVLRIFGIGGTVLPARPWATGLARALESLGQS